MTLTTLVAPASYCEPGLNLPRSVLYTLHKQHGYRHRTGNQAALSSAWCTIWTQNWIQLGEPTSIFAPTVLCHFLNEATQRNIILVSYREAGF